MSLPLDREFIAQVVIVTAVCAGAWLMLVQPRCHELAHLEQQMQESGQGSAFATPDGIEALAGKLQAFNVRLADIRRRNLAAEDTSGLYGTIMDLAAKRDVAVQSVQPSPLKELSKQSPIKATRVEVAVVGRFDQVARFMDDLAAIDAFIRPTSLQLMPVDGGGEDAVSARFGCEVLTFTVNEVLVNPAPVAVAAAASTNGGANGQH
jgi:Tfp pilus assembly protein PilO